MTPLVKSLKAAANGNRLRLLRRVLQDRKPVRQQDLVRTLRISQCLAARYLQDLENAELIIRERKGLAVYYRPGRPSSADISRLIRFLKNVAAGDGDAAEKRV